MKRLLQVSLWLNLLLVVGLVWRNEFRISTARIPRMEVGEPASVVFQRRAAPTAFAAIARTPWQSLDSRDIPRWMANLRAIGCPEATLRELVVFRVCRESRRRFLELESESARVWGLTRNESPREQQARQEQVRQVRSEMIFNLESLLDKRFPEIGAELMGWAGFPEDGLSSLSAGQRRQVRDWESSFSRLTDELRQKAARGNFSLEDLAAFRQAEQDRRAALSGLLTPDQFSSYLYQQSSAANYVRQNLPEAKSELEFRSVVDLAARFGMVNDTPGMSPPVGTSQEDDPVFKSYQAQEAAFNQALKDLLGEDRIAEQKAEEEARAAAELKTEIARNEENDRSQLLDMASSVGVNPADALRFFEQVKAQEPDYRTKYAEMEKQLTGTTEEKQKQMENLIKADLNGLAIQLMGAKGPAVIEKLLQQH